MREKAHQTHRVLKSSRACGPAHAAREGSWAMQHPVALCLLVWHGCKVWYQRFNYTAQVLLGHAGGHDC